jgi:hypothetical protein
MMFEMTRKSLAAYDVVLEPDEDRPEWWAGAPSVAVDDQGTYYLAARMREGNSPRGRRGYEIRILKSPDGGRFEPVNHITREAAGVPGFERPALLRDPQTGLFKLYGCAGLDRGWVILRFDDVEDPAAFDPSTARPVLLADEHHDKFVHVSGYKDPVVHWDGACWHLFVIGIDRIERIHHFLSSNGEQWEPAEGVVLENNGWHSFYTRPACVLPMDVGCLFVYEGSHYRWHDPVYNIATGLAYSPDLRTFVDLTPHEPLLKSTTPGDYHTWRYSHWMAVNGTIRVYFEAARPNNTNEIRLGIMESTAAIAKRNANPTAGS